MCKDILSELYKKHTGKWPESIEPLTGSGSNRQYFRLKGETSIIGVCGNVLTENKAFLYMARHFKEKGIPVPEVFAVSDDEIHYIQEDLGDRLLFQEIENGKKTGVFSDDEKALIRKTISLLPDIQFKGAEDLDFSYCYPISDFNRRTIMWDLNYFKYCFLKVSGLEFDENLLEDDFETMSSVLLESESETFMYRDFQSRNVIIKDKKPYFIDFQGGRKGPVYYDVASFLWQAKANFPSELKEEMIETYVERLNRYVPTDIKEFRNKLKHFVLFRTMQVLGAYGFRGLVERKQHFIESIPFAQNNLKELLEDNFEEYPYLNRILKDLSVIEINTLNK